ncbi:hypothetical protein DFH07DRAFT_953470 [Mycena maculata]|uniref:Zn(2)-C6 fungal-type domain-containing protein n=1 Tax=Mycena maculata TaxID=230809 RepID=A0AAD7NQV0_9AGAR|nr:hypothetical protein DFH07DRAFT_953470 [Mycena maculata]
MATYNPPLPPLHPPARSTAKRRRTIMACTNCRQRKVKCITTEQPPKDPCARCTRNQLTCEYVSMVEQEEYLISATQTPEFPNMGPTPSLTWLPPTMAHNGLQGHGMAPRLPYTGPPPAGRRPRYSNQSISGVPGGYPDLSLPDPSQEPADTRYSNPSAPSHSRSQHSVDLYPGPSQSMDPRSYGSHLWAIPPNLSSGHSLQDPRIQSHSPGRASQPPNHHRAVRSGRYRIDERQRDIMDDDSFRESDDLSSSWNSYE